MATGIRARRSGVRNPVGENGFFSSSKLPYRLGCPPCFLFNGYGVYFPGVKPPGLGIDHPPPCRVAVIRNAATLRSLPFNFSI